MKISVANPERRITCLRIEPIHAGASIVRFTDYPVDLKMGGNTYKSDSGYEFSGFGNKASLAPGVIDLEGILITGGITRDQIAARIYDNARVYLFATTWDNPIVDDEPLAKFIFGKARIQDDRYVVELMSLIDVVGQGYNQTYTALCRFQLGSTECGVDLDALEESTSITSVTSLTQMQVSTAEAADHYAYGTIEFTSGPNANLGRREIKSQDASGNLELFHPFQYAITASETVILRPGCRKRATDCLNKFNNKLRYGGFEYVPTESQSRKWGKK